MALLSHNKSTLIATFVRVAIAQANPNDFLLGLITGNFEVTTKQDATVLVSTTTGGSDGLPSGPSESTIAGILLFGEIARKFGLN